MTTVPTAPVVLREQHDAGNCILQLYLPPDLAYFPGHFPQAPVLPGIALIGWALQLAASRLGISPVCREVEALKFQHVLQPGDETMLTLRFDEERQRLYFAYRSEGTMYASGRLVLVSPP